MVHETTKRDPERIYLEPWPYSPEGRLWSEENVWPLYTWPPDPEGESERATGVEYIRADLHAAEIARLSRELEALRRIAVDLHWMARRYVDGRTSYATRLFNDHTRALLALGVELNPTGDGTIWARDAMGRAYDGLSEEEAAQGEPAPAWLHDEDVARLRRELETARERERRLREAVLDTIRKACRCEEYYRAIEREDPQCQAHDIEYYVEQVFEASG